MPIATPTGNDEGERFELATCPGGYVVLKRLDYGQKMYRRGLLSKAKMEAGGSGNRADRRKQSSRAFTAELELMNEKVTAFEFANCIVEHNLTYLMRRDDPMSEAALNFRDPEHVRMLDGRVGEEIDELITDLNNWESDEDTGK